jgi:hypothetical protein
MCLKWGWRWRWRWRRKRVLHKHTPLSKPYLSLHHIPLSKSHGTHKTEKGPKGSFLGFRGRGVWGQNVPTT